MRGWVFMVLRTFMMLNGTCGFTFTKNIGKRRIKGCEPDNSCLNNIFAIFVLRLHDNTGICIDTYLHWYVQVQTAFL